MISVLCFINNSHELMLIKKALEREEDEFFVIEASDFKAFKSALSTKNFDVVLIDLNTLGVDNLIAIRNFKDQNPFIPVIVLIDPGLEKIAIKARKHGADDYLIKDSTLFQRLPHIIRCCIGAFKSGHELNEIKQLFLKSQVIGNIGICIYDHLEDHMMWSEPTYKIFGVDPNNFQPSYEKFRELIHASDREAIDILCSNSLEQRQSKFETEFRILQQDTGEIRVVKMVCEHQKDTSSGRILKSIGIIQDITEIKITEQTLKENLEKFRAIFEHSPDVIIISTLDGVVVDVNKSFTHVSGYKREEVIGKSLAEFNIWVEPSDREIFYSKLEEKGELYNLEIKFRLKDGSIRIGIVSAVVISIYQKPHVLSIVHDITEFKEVHNKLEKAKEIAEKALAIKDDFLSNMSHEIRTPINAIIGFNYLLQKTKLTPEQLKYVKKIEMASEHLLNIVNDILDLSKIEAGKLQIDSVGFNLNIILDNVYDMMDYYAREKGLKLFVVKEKDVPIYLIGDPVRIEQVLLNLVNNAIKFTKKGEVALKVEKVKQEGKRVTLRFSVTDTGIGLTNEEMKKLFQKFDQVDTSITRKYGGTGLGLTISKKLVDMMNGKIWVESVKGVGSTFFFTVELDIWEKKGKDKLTPKMLQGLKVLIVSHEELTRQVIEDYCEQFGFDVKTATNGKDALGILNNEMETDVVFLDWEIPDIGGSKFYRLFKKDDTILNKPKIVLITRHGTEEVSRHVKKFGLDGFLIKPIDESLLFSLLMELFFQDMDKTSTETYREINELKPLQGAKVLLVEDNKINQELIVEILKNKGVSVEVAENGQVAVEKIFKKGDEFDLVLMDVQMPVMDGYTATKKIRAYKKWDNLPIIALTANVLSGVKEEVQRAGMNDYITKPINVDEFYNTLVKWLKRRQDTGKMEEEKILQQPDEKKNSVMSGVEFENGLMRFAGKKKLYLKVLKQFIESYGDFEEKLIQAVRDKNKDTAIRLIHDLKGVAGNIGATNLYLQLNKFEEFVKRNFLDEKAIKERLYSIIRVLNRVIADIKEYENQQKKTTKTSFSKNFNIDELKSVVDKLKINLKEYNANSIEYLDRLKEILKGCGYDMDLIELEKYVSSYDFDSATKALEKFMGKLKGF